MSEEHSITYNKTPLGPMGSAVQIHESRENSGTWAEWSINGWYLGTSPEHYKMADIQDKIIKEYKFDQKVTTDGFIYTEIQKEMYGLPQAGIIAQELLADRLEKHGYSQSKIIPGLWTHATRPICFTLVVDDFAVKYTREQDANHLISAIKEHYKMTIDKSATKYIGLTIEWDYENRKVHTSMLGYLSKAFVRLKHETPHKKQNSPHLTHMSSQITEPKQKIQNQKMTSPHSEQTKQNSSKPSRVHSSIMDVQSTARYSRH
jgi:hypothetical protein